MSDSSAPQDSLTQEEIVSFVKYWFEALDVHAPIEAMYPLLADAGKGLRVIFPDGDITDPASFKKWYDRVTNLFFDESHTVQSVQCDIHGTEATLDIIVGWQASWWEAPAAKSKRTSMNATQQWTVRRSSKNAKGIEIVTYNATVKPFEYAPGFAQL